MEVKSHSGASVALNEGLNRQVASVVDGKKPFKNIICDVSFAKKKHLNRHIATVHENKNCSVFNVTYVILPFARKKHLKCSHSISS